MQEQRILLYDTTLRDGSQAEGISFSIQDKVLITEILDNWGIDFVEGGWPGSNPKDIEYFDTMAQRPLRHARVTAFGATAHPKNKVDDDPNLAALIASRAPVCTIFGKTWDFHVKHALKISPEKNLQLIEQSVRFLKKKDRMVIFDAEHFFDGFEENAEYALRALEAALQGGCDYLCLCDTNGGTLTDRVAAITKEVRSKLSTDKIGAHFHNDSGLGAANTVALIKNGGTMVQGTINGIGERCGNADLITIIPLLVLKLKRKTSVRLRDISAIARAVAEISNTGFNERAPFVGKSAFAHKGGIHVSAVARNPKTYEHIDPELVGNQRRVLVSELSGKSNILFKAGELDIPTDGEKGRKIVQLIKQRELEGYHYEGAEASLELMIKRELFEFPEFFTLRGYRVITERHPERERPISVHPDIDFESFCEATIKIEVNGTLEHTAANGNGPVQALDNALKKALTKFYPAVDEIALSDYKVRVIDESTGTGAKVRVLIDHQKDHKKWSTIGVDNNIITASWLALTDGVLYYLYKHESWKTESKTTA